jgi:hypothetical protein
LRVCVDERAFEAAVLNPEGAADAFRLGLNRAVPVRLRLGRAANSLHSRRRVANVGI